MVCPKCGVDIGGTVEMGTRAYKRVSEGCCPHCGMAVPGIGFAQSSAPRKISAKQYAESTKNDVASYKTALKAGKFGAAGMVVIPLAFTFSQNYLNPESGSKTTGQIIATVIISLAVAALYLFAIKGINYYYYIGYTPYKFPNFSTGQVTYTENDMKSATLAAICTIISYAIFGLACFFAISIIIAIIAG